MKRQTTLNTEHHRTPKAQRRECEYESILSESADRNLQRQNTVTIEEIEESNGHASDADTGADRPSSSHEIAVTQLPGVQPTP
jgi:hypothetical protein